MAHWCNVELAFIIVCFANVHAIVCVRHPRVHVRLYVDLQAQLWVHVRAISGKISRAGGAIIVRHDILRCSRFAWCVLRCSIELQSQRSLGNFVSGHVLTVIRELVAPHLRRCAV